jgi:hypothetical protein
MRTRTNWTWILAVGALAVTFLLGACGGTEEAEESVGSIQESLELENGGFTTGDELPSFGVHDPALDLMAIEADLEVPELPAEMQALMGQAQPPQPGVPAKPPCPHGMLKGVWKQVKGDFGVFKGKWASADGKVVGHLKGIFGKDKKGHNILFGKYIGAKGKFRGLLKGRYGKGHFIGRWRGVHGLKGVFIGAYGPAKCVALPDGTKKCMPGAGNLVGKWRAFCPECQVKCAPGFAHPPNHPCICVPQGVIPCLMGMCPPGAFCDPCPPLPGCQPGAPCNMVCAPPICRPLPPPPNGANQPPSNQDPNQPPSNEGDPNLE